MDTHNISQAAHCGQASRLVFVILHVYALYRRPTLHKVTHDFF